MGNKIRIKEGELVKLEQQLKRKLEEKINNVGLLSQVGQYIVKNMIGEARLGKGYTTTGPNPESGDRVEKFQPLKKTTIKRREELAKYNQNGTLFSPKKSNLTLTGKTLNSISFIVSNEKPLISIVPYGDHPGYIQKNGKRSRGAPFQDILRWQREKGRNVFGVSARIYRSVVSMIKSHLRRELK